MEKNLCVATMSRPTLLLLPGLAADATMWQAQLAALAGFAPRVADVHARAHSMPAMAALLLEEHAGPLVLCGASMGGMIAMEVARQAPDRIAGLALLGTTARPESDEMRQLREAGIAQFAQGRIREVLEPNVPFAFHPDHAREPGLVEAYMDFVLRAGPAQLVRQNRAVIDRPDARPHLQAIKAPVLVLCGDSDLLTPPECAREIAALVPQAELSIVARCGHMLTMEQPEAVNALLGDWLARVMGTGS